MIIGGRLGNVLFYDPQYYLAHPLDVFKVWEGGMAFHGGLIGAFIGMLLFARRYRDAGADRDRPLLAGRADRPVLRPDRQFHQPGAVGPPDRRALGDGLPGTDGLPRHPSQIYEALLEGVLAFVILFALARMGALRGPGLIAGAFGVLYGRRASSASSSASPIRGSRTSDGG